MNALRKHLSLAVLVFVATGCHRKNDDGTPRNAGGFFPAGCTAQAPSSYHGATVPGICNPYLFPPGWTDCQQKYQLIPVQSDVINYPLDRVSVTLTKPDGSTLKMPTPWINLGHNRVELVNGFEQGYTTYAIDEQLCR